jgi:hypothetical protein
MGVHGLWKYLGSHNVSKLLPSNAKIAVEVQHLFFDMNGVMHTAYTRKNPTVAATIAATIAILKQMLELFNPTQSIILVFDGPAPLSKLSEQRERRQSHLSDAQKIELNEAEIVTGGAFVIRCEQEVTTFVQQYVATSRSSAGRVHINGSTTPGEGETKIANELQCIFAQQIADNKYNGSDNIVLVGNDSDLVLTSIACTAFTNFFVVNPFSLIVSCIGDIFQHWAHAVPNKHLPIEHLSSHRIDFVFIMLLAGGDHYPGIEDDAVDLWRKYRKLRADGGFYRRPLVKNESFDIEWELFRQMCAKDHGKMTHYQGSKNKRQQVKASQGSSVSPEPGIALLKGAIWALRTVCTGACPDYHFQTKNEQPRVAHLRSAVNRGGLGSAVAANPSLAQPLLPLQVFVGVTSAKRFLPAAVQEIITTNVKFHRFSQLTSSPAIASMVLEIFALVPEGGLTASEQERMRFSLPCSMAGAVLTPYAFPAETNSLRFSLPAFVEEITFTSLLEKHHKTLQRSQNAKKALLAKHVDCVAGAESPDGGSSD